MPELKIPVDFERLPDYQQLVVLLGGEDGATPPVKAAFIFTRLFVDLAYQAEKTNEPGLLTAAGAELFCRSVHGRVGLGCAEIIEILCRSELLVMRSVSNPPTEAMEYFCPRFAKLNPHLSGDFKPGHLKGADLSAHVRRKRGVAEDAAKLSMLLPIDTWKGRDGKELDANQINRTIRLIKTLDNCTRRPGRNKSEFGEGLIADAAAVADAHTDDELEAACRWLVLQREHPAVPKTTEQLLQQWETVKTMANPD